MTTLVNVDEKESVFTYSEISNGKIYYIKGFNKPNRCEVQLYYQDISGGSESNKLIESLMYSGKDKKLRSAGFVRIQKKQNSIQDKDTSNKRKLDNAEQKQDKEAFTDCLVLIFTNGEAESYEISHAMKISKINDFKFTNKSLSEVANSKILILNDIVYFILQNQKQKSNEEGSNVLVGYSLLTGGKTNIFKDIKSGNDTFIIGSDNNDLFLFDINETVMSIINLNNKSEQIISVDFLLNEQNEKIIIKDIKRSKVHDNLYYFLFDNDDTKIHVYNLESNEFISRFNSINDDSISHFETFKIGNIEYLAVLKNAEDEEEKSVTSLNFFKCIIRRNCKNVNTNLCLLISNIPKKLQIENFKICSANNEQLLNLKISKIEKKIFSENITELLNSKTKQASIEISISENDIENIEDVVEEKDKQNGDAEEDEEMLEGDEEPKRVQKNKPSKPKKTKKNTIFFKTNDDSVNSLILQFKKLNSKNSSRINKNNNYEDENEPEDLEEVEQDRDFMNFLISHNYNSVLIKTILKNLSTEEIDSLLIQLIKNIKKDEVESLSYLRLSNWFKAIFIINGGHLVKNSSSKKLQLLKDFQMRIKSNNDNLNNLLNLQGKLTLLKSQYELRNRIADDANSNDQLNGNDSDDDLSNIQSGNNVKTQTRLLNNISNDGVQVINEDEIIYDNGEIDENLNDDDDDDEEEDDDDDDDEGEDEE